MICTEPACAKLNLALDILGKRPDGYHEMRMVMQSIDLADHVTVSTCPGKEIVVTTDLPYLPKGDGNIAAKAALWFFSSVGMEPEGLAIDIQKNEIGRAHV